MEKLEPDRVRGVERASTLARLVSLERVLEDQKKRSILLHALPAQKLAELENRMNTSLTTVDKMSAIDGKIRNTILGFFGQSRSTEPSEVFLTADPTIRTQRGLFPHQKQVASDVERYLYRETGRAMLHLPTGVGKTRTAMSVVATHLRNGHNRLVVWLANNSEILEQAAAEFEQTWHAVGDRDVTCHRFWGNRDAPDSGMRDGIIVAGLAKLHSLGKTSERLERLGDCTTFVVFDEAHQALAPTYRRVTEILSRRNPRTPLLGLSATPGRTWNDPGEDIELSELFHHNKVTLDFGEENPVTHLTEHGYLSKATFRTINFAAGAHSRTSFVDGDTVDGEYSEGTLTALGDDDDRNLQILACIRSLAEHHSRILVFAPSVRAAELISSVAGASGLQADCITGVT
ncbi:MAG: DEAD/DEAH box helicase family protein, partial [Acidimicrobiaceae bacterium]|nr:DEAD/DEAH box helicase family protein [Acidimicrobiaceae bacterium]